METLEGSTPARAARSSRRVAATPPESSSNRDGEPPETPKPSDTTREAGEGVGVGVIGAKSEGLGVIEGVSEGVGVDEPV